VLIFSSRPFAGQYGYDVEKVIFILLGACASPREYTVFLLFFLKKFNKIPPIDFSRNWPVLCVNRVFFAFSKYHFQAR